MRKKSFDITVSEKEKELIELYRTLNAEGQDQALAQIRIVGGMDRYIERYHAAKVGDKLIKIEFVR